MALDVDIRTQQTSNVCAVSFYIISRLFVLLMLGVLNPNLRGGGAEGPPYHNFAYHGQNGIKSETDTFWLFLTIIYGQLKKNEDLSLIGYFFMAFFVLEILDFT